ncbi:hypothetical protein TcWFU_008156 [Taenia crassiceps]|uniref:Secreted protein n=1 Tax=Taenia crassiceps TaxID=6207 RepID=A0ABR4PZ87_9CEST
MAAFQAVDPGPTPGTRKALLSCFLLLSSSSSSTHSCVSPLSFASTVNRRASLTERLVRPEKHSTLPSGRLSVKVGSRTKQAILPPYCIQHPVVVTQSPTQTGDQAGLRTPTPKSLLICALIPLPFQCFMSGLLSSTAAFSTSPLRSSPTAPLSAFLHTEAHPRSCGADASTHSALIRVAVPA